ncbi:hypothetical protein ALQ37_03133 [Pseudomonas syringae pv. aptata]|uniref:TniQ domain-containing protein n=2 Tax=Pseudomonas syringae TaxID=317 RepID=A0A0Q0DC06_PSEAP|nr:Uncharacterized protein ALO85_01528 [Pseudomonas syringae pv. aptata]RMO64195.1 hypothetical protein ALQ37_03133 [Pseudomonas syringae pv. aptata]
MSFFQNVALQPGESLNSLLMRKAELNGYGCAQALLGERGLKLTAAYSSPELAQICECFELNEEQLSTTLIGQTHYLGQPSYLRNGHSPVCPECLASDGYAKDAWSHLLVTACPTHGTVLLGNCPDCEKPISYHRRTLELCDCGYDLRLAVSVQASEFAMKLSALMADAGVGEHKGFTEICRRQGFEPLLPDFLTLLAKHQAQRSGLPMAKPRFSSSSPLQDSLVMVGCLESLLSDWPARFDAAMQNQLRSGHGVGLAERIGSWYRELFSTYSSSSFDFVRDQFRAQVAEHFDGRLGLNTRAMMFGPDNAEAMQWFSAAEAARLLGVAPDILANLVIKQAVIGRVHQEGKSRFVAIHRSTLDQIASARAEYLSATEARRRLNVSKVFFERVVQAGGLRRYKRDERPVLVAGEFLATEIDAVVAQLIKRVRKKARVSLPIGIQDISVRHGISNAKIVAVLQDILQGTICPTGHVPALPGLAGLQFDQAEIEQRVRDNNPDVALSVDHLAQISGWKPAVIKKWIQGGYLNAVEEKHGKAKRDVVPVSALVRFLLTYVPTAEISKQLETKTPYLLQSLRPAKIECIVPPQEAGGAHRGLLLRSADLARGAQLRKPTIRDLANQMAQMDFIQC